MNEQSQHVIGMGELQSNRVQRAQVDNRSAQVDNRLEGLAPIGRRSLRDMP